MIERVTVTGLAQGGEAVGRLTDGCVVFVAGALPGEVVELKVVQRKKRWARGELLRVVEPARDRIGSDCPHDSVCGGCTFRHARYEAELAAKVAAGRDTLARLGGLSLDHVTVHAAVQPDAYRVRVSLHVRDGRLGFFESGSHAVFDIDARCRAVDPRISRVMGALRPVAQSMGRGGIFVETADADSVVATIHGDADRTTLETLAAVEGIRGVRQRDLVFGEYAVNSAEAFGIESDHDVPPERFRQSNGPMAGLLRDLVKERCGAGTELVELYAGSGNFTFAVRDRFETIRAWELDSDAVRVGNELASVLAAPHVVFGVADLDNELSGVEAGSVVLLDPPREGAARVCERLATTHAARIVYVSCDVATLARDLKKLQFGFRIVSVDFVDMFPRTAHLEAIAVLERVT